MSNSVGVRRYVGRFGQSDSAVAIASEMITGSGMDGETQVLPARVRSTIQSIKEIVKNHSDVDIYAALKENSMDPNETIQKLLNQGLLFSLFTVLYCF